MGFQINILIILKIVDQLILLRLVGFLNPINNDICDLALHGPPRGLHIWSTRKCNRSVNLSGGVFNPIKISVVHNLRSKLTAVYTAFQRIEIERVEILHIDWIIHDLLIVIVLNEFVLLFFLIAKPECQLLVAVFYRWNCSALFFNVLILITR